MVEKIKLQDFSNLPASPRSAEANKKKPDPVAKELKLADEILRLMRAL